MFLVFSAFTCGSTSSVAHNRATLFLFMVFVFPVVLSPCRGGELERVHDPESQAGGSVATGWASLAGQVNGPPVWASTRLPVNTLTTACNSQRQSKPDGFKREKNYENSKDYENSNMECPEYQ